MTRLPRRLHAGAWWLWAIGLGAAATRTTNPVLLGLILAVIGLVVAARRSPGTHRGLRVYLAVALVMIGIRVVFRMLFGGGVGDHVLFSLPTLPLPDWWSGVMIGGPVTAEALLAALYDGLRLATIVLCVGAANTLADPRRLLKSLPRALYDAGAAAAVALSLAPEIVESIGRVRRARRLRGNPGRGLASLRSLIVPVLEDAVGRSLALAASMDSRGYGRLATAAGTQRRLGGVLGISALGLLGIGVFGLVGGSLSALVAAALLVVGVAAGGGAMAVTGRSVGRSVYRPDRFGLAGWVVAASGLLAAGAVWMTGMIDPAAVVPAFQPLTWPVLPPVAAAAILLATLPAWISPTVPAVSPDAIRRTTEEPVT